MNEYYVPITWAEIEMLGSKGIGALGIRVYMVIKMRAYGHRAQSWASQKRIQKDLRLGDGTVPNIRTVQRSIRALENAGLIVSSTKSSSAGTNVYTITNKLGHGKYTDTSTASRHIDRQGHGENADTRDTVKMPCKEEKNKIYFNNKGQIEPVELSKYEPTDLYDLMIWILKENKIIYDNLSNDDIEYMIVILESVINKDWIVNSTLNKLKN